MTKPSKELLAMLAQGQARAAAYSLREARAAGYSLPEESEIPLVEKPYTRILADIVAGSRKYDQSTFGPECDPGTNLCGTPMCSAGHIVNMAGEAGYRLKKNYGWELAATLLFERAHPGWPQQSYCCIPQEWAMAHIEVMAEREAAEAAAGNGGA